MKLLGTALAVVMLSTTAYADSTRANVQDHYTEVSKRYPYTQTECTTVDVPIYGRSSGGASAGDVLGGMIIGGLIGKGVTNKDNGAAAGAVIGGMIAADKNQGKEVITGYRQQQQCKDVTRYDIRTETVYSHSTITFWQDGKKYSLRFQK